MPGTRSRSSTDSERTVTVTVVDDGGRGGRPDPGQRLQQLDRCSVQIDGAGDLVGSNRPVGDGRRCATRRHRRRIDFSGDRHVDALPVGHRYGEVQPVEVGSARRATGCLDRIMDTSPGREFVDARTQHGSGDMHPRPRACGRRNGFGRSLAHRRWRGECRSRGRRRGATGEGQFCLGGRSRCSHQPGQAGDDGNDTDGRNDQAAESEPGHPCLDRVTPPPWRLRTWGEFR